MRFSMDDSPERSHPPPAFGSSTKLEALALEAVRPDGDEQSDANASSKLIRPMHEVTFSTDDKPKLLSQVPFGANGCAYFPFDELCDRSLGAADYFGLFKKFHTLALEGVPILGQHNRTAAYRFVTLVDVMYENKARLVCTAEGSPQELFEKIITIADAQKRAPRTSTRSRRNDEADLCVDNELGFAKDRTVSRLTEMNSKEYLEQHATENQLVQEEGAENAMQA